MHGKRVSLVAIALFAVTIGVTTAIYAVVDAVILRPISMRAPNRTVVIWQRDDPRDTPVVEVAHGEVDHWRRNARSVEAFGVFSSVNWSLALVDGDSRARLAYAAVSAPFFEVVGVPPAMGRLLDTGDEDGNEPRAAVISDLLWRQRFGASPRIIGAIIRVQDDVESPVRPIEVVGVMPPGFDFPRGAQIWVPAAPSLRGLAQRAGHDAGDYLANLRVFYAVGRLRQDSTVPQVACGARCDLATAGAGERCRRRLRYRGHADRRVPAGHGAACVVDDAGGSGAHGPSGV